MELTDETIKSFFFRVKNELDNGDEVDEIERMALAHNAAKKAEPWNSADVPLEYITKSADGTQFRNVCPLPAHAIAWQVAAPPDLAAKLKEARELLDKWKCGRDNSLDGLKLMNDTNDFLARTK